MSKVFFGTPFKALVLAILICSLGTLSFDSSSAKAQNWDEERLLLDIQNGGAELFKEISPSIIQIYNTIYDYYRPGDTWVPGGAGSGYVIDKQGHAITNKHVISDSVMVEVAFYGDEDTGKRHRAVVIGAEPALDLAIIKIDADPSLLHPIKLGDSDRIQVGDIVATCGSPGGDAGITDLNEAVAGGATDSWLDFFNFNIGVVDEILEFHQAFRFYAFDDQSLGQYYGSNIQYLFHVSAAINQGNSGGPCINAYGEAIGTNTWGRPGAENVGYSVPTNLLKRSAAEIIQYGRPRSAWCGIICHDSLVPYKWLLTNASVQLTNEWDLWFDVEVENPVIEHVNPYSPAGEAGLKEGDIILTVDNKQFNDIFELYKYLINGRIGQEVVFVVERNGTGIPPISVELAEKKIRYDSVSIDSWTMAGYQKPYKAELTY